MYEIKPEQIFKEVPKLAETAEQVSRGIHAEVLKGGDEVRDAVDILHGKWLGHPLHPVLTDFTIGAWVLAGVFDLLGLTGSHTAKRAADRLIGMGIISAVATAAAGIADFSTIPRRAISTGAVHGIMNVGGLLVYILSFNHRRGGRRGMGQFLSSMGLGMLTVSAWLGGELVFRYGVGVNKNTEPHKPEDWTPVLDTEKLAEREPKRVEVNGEAVLLYRENGQVYAIGAVCTHDGGPLEEGKFYDLCVECPWHQSVFDLRDGSVVHGPTTYIEPSYETRVTNGFIEVRLRQNT